MAIIGFGTLILLGIVSICKGLYQELKDKYSNKPAVEVSAPVGSENTPQDGSGTTADFNKFQ